MRQLYLSIAVPQMLYAADVFISLIAQCPGAPVCGSCAVVRKLTSVQRFVAIKITGALSTTATDFLDLHSGLPLLALVNHVLHRATLRLASLPAAHPLFKIVRKATNEGPSVTPRHL